MNLTHDIILNNKYRVRNMYELTIHKSAEKLSDTCVLKFPSKVYDKVFALPQDVIYGSGIVVKMGYNNDNIQEFEGYLVSVKEANKMLVLTFEDSAFLLRNEVKNNKYKDISLNDLLEDIISQVEGLKLECSPKCQKLKYDSFVINGNATAYEVLEKIKEEYRLHIFVRKQTVYVNLKYELEAGNVKYDLSKNVEKVGLTYQQEEYKKVKVEVVGIDRNNKKVSVIVGQKGGDSLKINRYNIMDVDTLKAIGNEEIKKWRYTGYKGNITTWLQPYCTYGVSANVFDKDYPERKAIYYVDAVTTKISNRGGERKVALGIKLN